MWNLQTAQVAYEMDSHPQLTSCVRFSPDGKTLASSTWIGPEVKLFNVADGSLRHTLTNFTGRVNCVDFSPDGSVLAAATLKSRFKIYVLLCNACLRARVQAVVAESRQTGMRKGRGAQKPTKAGRG